MKTKNILCEECHGMGFISMVGENSIWSERCNKCNGAGNIEVPITNFDKITESVESLAWFIDVVTSCCANELCETCPINKQKGVGCYKHTIKEWLEKESENG